MGITKTIRRTTAMLLSVLMIFTSVDLAALQVHAEERIPEEGYEITSEYEETSEVLSSQTEEEPTTDEEGSGALTEDQSDEDLEETSFTDEESSEDMSESLSETEETESDIKEEKETEEDAGLLGEPGEIVSAKITVSSNSVNGTVTIEDPAVSEEGFDGVWSYTESWSRTSIAVNYDCVEMEGRGEDYIADFTDETAYTHDEENHTGSKTVDYCSIVEDKVNLVVYMDWNYRPTDTITVNGKEYYMKNSEAAKGMAEELLFPDFSNASDWYDMCIFSLDDQRVRFTLKDIPLKDVADGETSLIDEDGVLKVDVNIDVRPIEKNECHLGFFGWTTDEESDDTDKFIPASEARLISVQYPESIWVDSDGDEQATDGDNTFGAEPLAAEKFSKKIYRYAKNVIYNNNPENENEGDLILPAGSVVTMSIKPEDGYKIEFDPTNAEITPDEDTPDQYTITIGSTRATLGATSKKILEPGVAVVTAKEPEDPKESIYYENIDKDNDGIVDINAYEAAGENIIGLFSSWEEAVDAVNERGIQDRYEFILTGNVGGNTEENGPITLTFPAAANMESLAVVSVPAADSETDGKWYDIYYSNELKPSTGIIFKDVGLAPSAENLGIKASYWVELVNTEFDKGSALGSITGNGESFVRLKISSGTGEYGRISGSITNCDSLMVESDLTVKGEIKTNELTINGNSLKAGNKVTVTDELDLYNNSVLDTVDNNGAAVTIGDIYVYGNNGYSITYSRKTATNSASGTTSLTITGALIFDDPDRYPDPAPVNLIEVGSGGNASAVNIDGSGTAKMGPDRLIASIGNNPTSSFTYVSASKDASGNISISAPVAKGYFDPEAETILIKSGKGLYFASMTEEIRHSVTLLSDDKSDSKWQFIDYNGAITQINDLSDSEGEYTVGLLPYVVQAADNAELKDTVLTDKKPVGALALPGQNKAARTTIKSLALRSTGSDETAPVTINATGSIKGFKQVVFDNISLHTTKLTMNELSLSNTSLTATDAVSIDRLDLVASDIEASSKATVKNLATDGSIDSFITVKQNTKRLPLFTVNGFISGQLYVKVKNSKGELIVEKDTAGTGEVKGSLSGVALIKAPKANTDNVRAYELKDRDGIVSYLNASGYVINEDKDIMLIKVSSEDGIFTYAKTWNDAVSAINNAKSNSDYTIAFLKSGKWTGNSTVENLNDAKNYPVYGSYATAGNPDSKAPKALAYPKTTGTITVTKDLSDGDEGTVTLISNGKFSPKANLTIKDISINESVYDKKTKKYSLTDKLTLVIANDRTVTFVNAGLKFVSVTGKKGELVLDNSGAIVDGAVNVRSLGIKGGTISLADNGAFSATGVYVSGNGNSIDTKGKITITDIYGNDALEDSLSIGYRISAPTSKAAGVSMLTINGNVAKTKVVLKPGLPVYEGGAYADYHEATESDLKDVLNVASSVDEGSLTYGNKSTWNNTEAGKAKGWYNRKLATLPKAANDLFSVSGNTGENALNLYKSGSGLYISSVIPSIIVTGYSNDNYSDGKTYEGHFLTIGEAFSEIGRIRSKKQAGDDNAYVMIELGENIGTAEAPVKLPAMPSNVKGIKIAGKDTDPVTQGNQNPVIYMTGTALTLKSDTELSDLTIISRKKSSKKATAYDVDGIYSIAGKKYALKINKLITGIVKNVNNGTASSTGLTEPVISKWYVKDIVCGSFTADGDPQWRSGKGGTPLIVENKVAVSGKMTNNIMVHTGGAVTARTIEINKQLIAGSITVPDIIVGATGSLVTEGNITAKNLFDVKAMAVSVHGAITAGTVNVDGAVRLNNGNLTADNLYIGKNMANVPLDELYGEGGKENDMWAGVTADNVVVKKLLILDNARLAVRGTPGTNTGYIKIKDLRVTAPGNKMTVRESKKGLSQLTISGTVTDLKDDGNHAELPALNEPEPVEVELIENDATGKDLKLITAGTLLINGKYASAAWFIPRPAAEGVNGTYNENGGIYAGSKADIKAWLYGYSSDDHDSDKTYEGRFTGLNAALAEADVIRAKKQKDSINAYAVVELTDTVGTAEAPIDSITMPSNVKGVMIVGKDMDPSKEGVQGTEIYMASKELKLKSDTELKDIKIINRTKTATAYDGDGTYSIAGGKYALKINKLITGIVTNVNNGTASSTGLTEPVISKRYVEDIVCGSFTADGDPQWRSGKGGTPLIVKNKVAVSGKMTNNIMVHTGGAVTAKTLDINKQLIAGSVNAPNIKVGATGSLVTDTNITAKKVFDVDSMAVSTHGSITAGTVDVDGAVRLNNGNLTADYLYIGKNMANVPLDKLYLEGGKENDMWAGVTADNVKVKKLLILDNARLAVRGKPGTNTGYIKIKDLRVTAPGNKMTARESLKGISQLTISGTVTDLLDDGTHAGLPDQNGPKPVEVELIENDATGKDLKLITVGTLLINSRKAGAEWFVPRPAADDVNCTYKQGSGIYAGKE